ncbi:site-2 protease family protein [Candidatus Methylopumilus turicensis]|jgi:Zn-dependent protease|uniref:Peptidase M50 n=1 Tax=Candidatus Methylopumilus turicensis TaxID=1581680 RepID=A0A0B7ITW6_9PROT|nr:site-2 protease family protein [Candidatus Methylopumilus turicensis]CEN55664.1 Peptidase M50 [Candidatus Methylopumilus turicensis]
MDLTYVQKIAIYALPVIFAITVHEAAHGFAARFFGDMTADRAGRITLNPLKHIDPIGTILLPALTLLVGGILFGWAKPVPVDFSRLRNPKRDMLWVAAAGPASNFVMALFWALMIKLSVTAPNVYSEPMALMGQAGVMINVVLMVLNLLPLPPLDGGRIAVSLLPNQLAYQYAQIERYGFIILIVLLATGVLGQVMEPFIEATIRIIEFIF